MIFAKGFFSANRCSRSLASVKASLKYDTGGSNPRSYGVQFHARSRTLTTRNVNAAQPGGGRKRKGEKEERLEGDLNGLSSSTVVDSQIQPRSKQKKKRVDRNPTFVEGPKSLEPDRFDGGAGEEVFPNPPFPKSPLYSHPPGEGISGKAAAIAYLRIRGLANRGRQRTFFSVLAWVLRHAARDLGFEIAPDGFVRISDLLRFEPFQTHTLESFARECVGDIFDRFEVVSLPDLVNGGLREVWWARARACQTIPGVHASSKRIINMGRLQTVAYRAPLKKWPKIQKYGIFEDPDRLIRLYQSGEPYFRDTIPLQSKYICITIDAQKAAELGVMFFHTRNVELLAVGKNGAIPVEAIRSVVELEITKQKLI